MSKDGISRGSHAAYSDKNVRYSHLKDVDARLYEKTFRNKLKDRKQFTGTILKLEVSRDVVAAYGGTFADSEAPIFYRAWLRVEGIHDELLPNPCTAKTPEEQEYIIGLHSPPALSS